jgi:hypothetical protein
MATALQHTSRARKQQVEAAREMVRAGLARAEVAQAYGIDRTTAWRWTRDVDPSVEPPEFLTSRKGRAVWKRMAEEKAVNRKASLDRLRRKYETLIDAEERDGTAA